MTQPQVTRWILDTLLLILPLAYVHSVMDVQHNLYLRTNSRVSRVIFEGTKAVGVAYVPARNRVHTGEVKETIVKARKMVVLSSGTLGTPQILERSGVGSAELLKRLGIKVVSHLTGVGYVSCNASEDLLIPHPTFLYPGRNIKIITQHFQVSLLVCLTNISRSLFGSLSCLQ